jgi:energy-coupling factor transport system substrate-specific component
MLDAHAIVLSPLETLVLNLSLLAMVAWSMWKAERSLDEGSDVTVLVLLSLFAVTGRILLEPLPNVQPVTVIVLLVGIHYGATRSIGVATLVAITSNLVLGHGLWTLYQALGWSLVGVAGALLSDHLRFDEKLSVHRIAAISFIAAFAFDWVVSISVLHAIPAENLPVYIMVGLPFDLVHAVGNIAFAAWLSEPLSEMMSRHSSRGEVVVSPVKSAT